MRWFVEEGGWWGNNEWGVVEDGNVVRRRRVERMRGVVGGKL